MRGFFELNGKEDKKSTENIEETGSVVTERDGVTLHMISIIGQIEGHNLLPETQKTTKYEHILPSLVAIEESEQADGLLVIINTVGGDVEAGLAIAEMLAGMSKPTVSIVLGGGHSIGIPIAVSCDRSFIVPSATMTVHPVRTSGTVLGVPQAFVGLEKMQQRINKFIVGHSHITSRDLEKMMMNTKELSTDVGTVLDGAAAVSCGLIDSIGGLCDAISALKKLIEEKRENEKSDEKNSL
ncbi:MAG: ATP-dependent Clp protease proteolytic subunit [Clostridiales bacterium]|nr:ATP-dependent Clp protease proteolytic subunit [Clostridiales bacterium]